VDYLEDCLFIVRMSGRRGRGGKAKGGRAKGQGGQPTQQAKKPSYDPQNPVQELLHHLLHSAFEDLPKDALPDEETTFKCVTALEVVSRQILKEPKPAEYQKHAIKCCLTLQQTTKLNGNQSRQVIGIVFTYLLDELTKHWYEYGITKEDVHCAYWKSDDSLDPLFWKAEAITEAEYEAWGKAFHYLKGQK